MILVAGATGLVGAEVCRRLGAANKIRALVRPSSSPEKLRALESAGVELFTGDLKDIGSLVRACDGVDAIISTATSTLSRQHRDSIQTVDLDGQLNLVQAAKDAGVERFIFLSYRHQRGPDFPLSAAKRAVEQAVTGMNHTIVQAGFFMEVWLSPALGFDFPNAKAKIYGGGVNPLSFVSYLDVAAFCAQVVNDPRTYRHVIEFGGPGAVSPREVIEIFEHQSGRKYELEKIPESALRAQLESAQDPLEKSFAGLMLLYAMGDSIDMRGITSEFGLSLTSVRDYAKQISTTAAAAR